MGDRYFDEYDEVSFNRLMSVLDELEERSSNSWTVETCKKIKDKITTYYTVNTDEATGAHFLRIGWFGEELRNLLYLLLLYYVPESEEVSEISFASLVAKKKAAMQDPDYYKKCRLRHFKTEAMFLSNEDEKLLDKGRAILNVVGEKTVGLQMQSSDFMCRTWTFVRRQKTQETTYRFKQIPEGWSVCKKFWKYKGDEPAEQTVYVLNNETLKFSKTTESVCNPEEYL